MMTHAPPPPSPRRVYLRLTRACNAKCPYCPSWQLPKDMPEMRWLSRIVEEVAEVSTREVRITGGEPVLHPRFFELLKLLDERGLEISVITNGTLFAPALLPRALNTAIARLLISLDTPRDSVHDEIRVVPGLFEQARRGALAFRRARPDVAIEVNMVVSNRSVDDIDLAIESSAAMGAKRLNLIPIKDWPAMQVRAEQMRRHNARIAELRDLAARSGIEVLPVDFDLFGLSPETLAWSAQGSYPTRNRCMVPTFEAFVDAVTGLVWPCDSTPYASRNCHTCGDLNEQSFASIWRGSRFERLRRAYRNARPVPCSNKCDPSNAHNSQLYQLELAKGRSPVRSSAAAS